MTKPEQKKTGYTKATLERVLKARLAALTQCLLEAEVGGKGIDVVKEIKELDSMIGALSLSAKGQKQDGTKLEATKLEVGWAEWENMKPSQGKATTIKEGNREE